MRAGLGADWTVVGEGDGRVEERGGVVVAGALGGKVGRGVDVLLLGTLGAEVGFKGVGTAPATGAEADGVTAVRAGVGTDGVEFGGACIIL